MAISDFFKGKKEYQVSDFLLNHTLKDKYTFDPWPQIIFLNATGLKTIFQFTMEMASKYTGKVPLGLENTIVDQIERLTQEDILATSVDKVILPANLLYAIDNK